MFIYYVMKVLAFFITDAYNRIKKEADPFYSESNINHLRQIVHDIDTGKAKLTEHDLIEVD